MVYTVYKTTNIVNGKYYIGVHKTNNIDDSYIGSGKILNRAIKKYGRDNFRKDVLEVFENRAAAFELEARLVTEELTASSECYNVKLGGSGGFDFINDSAIRDNRTPDSIRRGGISSSNGFKHRRETDSEFDEKMREAQKRGYADRRANGFTFRDKNHTQETKRLLSELGATRTGERNSAFGTMWITDGLVNKKIKRGTAIQSGWRAGRV